MTGAAIVPTNGAPAARVEPAGTGLALGAKVSGMGDVFRLADQLAKARGFVPDAFVERPAAIAAVILTGMELGIGPMQSMREIHVIKGKPSISATLMLALARRAGVKTRWLVTTGETATIGVTVPGIQEQTLSFTKAQAQAAGLWGQGNWKTYPDAMLRARATSAAIRAFCPDVIGGSVYESESGELTDGIPSAEVLEGQVLPTAPRPVPTADDGPPIPRAVKDVNDAAMLRRYCAKYGEAIVKANNAERCIKRGEQLDVPAADVRAWLGIVEVAAVNEAPADEGYDPSEQDAPPPDDQ